MWGAYELTLMNEWQPSGYSAMLYARVCGLHCKTYF